MFLLISVIDSGTVSSNWYETFDDFVLLFYRWNSEWFDNYIEVLFCAILVWFPLWNLVRKYVIYLGLEWSQIACFNLWVFARNTLHLVKRQRVGFHRKTEVCPRTGVVLEVWSGLHWWLTVWSGRGDTAKDNNFGTKGICTGLTWVICVMVIFLERFDVVVIRDYYICSNWAIIYGVFAITVNLINYVKIT